MECLGWPIFISVKTAKKIKGHGMNLEDRNAERSLISEIFGNMSRSASRRYGRYVYSCNASFPYLYRSKLYEALSNALSEFGADTRILTPHRFDYCDGDYV